MKSPAFQFYPKQWLGDDKVLAMDWDARGLHFHFMCLAWQQPSPGTLPDDDDLLRRWAGNPDDEAWARLKKQVFTAWKKRGKKWIQNGLVTQAQKQAEYSKRQTENIKKRWNKRSSADTTVIPNGYQNDTLQFASSSSSSKKEPPTPLENSENENPSIPPPLDSEPVPTSKPGPAKAERGGPTVWDFNLAARLRDGLLADGVKERDLGGGEAKWAHDLSRIRRLRKIRAEEIVSLWDWARGDPFWRTVIFRPRDLDNNWPKIEAARQRASPPGKPSKLDKTLNTLSEWVNESQEKPHEQTGL